MHARNENEPYPYHYKLTASNTLMFRGVNPISFGGAKFYPSHGGGRSFGPKWLKPEARRAESGVAVLGRGQLTPSPP